MRLKLFPKIAMVMILLATIPVVVVGWQTATLNREHMESNILELHTNLANSLSNRIDNYLNGLAGKIRAFVETLRMQGITTAEPFQGFLGSNDEFVSIAFVNAAGKELLKTAGALHPEEKSPRNRAEDPVFKSFISQNPEGDSYEPKLGFSFEGSDPRLTIVFPYHPQNLSLGGVYMAVSLASLWKDITTEGAGVGGGGREAFVADKDGYIIAHSNPAVMARIFGEKDHKVSAKDHPIVQEALQKRSIGSREFLDPSGRSIIGAYSSLKWMGWVSVIQQPKETAYYAIYETRKRAMQIVLLSIGLAAVIAFFFAKNLSRPIFRLIDVARKIAAGDFNQTAVIDSKDEMGDLAHTFNEMTRELKRYSELQVDRLIEEKTKTESIIFSIGDGLVLTDRAGRIQLINGHAIRIFSLIPNDPAQEGTGEGPALLDDTALIGKNLTESVQDPKAKEALGELLSKPESRLVKEVMISDGAYVRHYQLSCEQVFTPHTGDRIGVVTVIHDVTLERQMDEMKEGFLHSITHDLRNPMTSITGFIRFLKDGVAGPINDDQKKMLETMDRASDRLLGMINDILDIAKIEAGKLDIELNPVALRPIIENVEALYKPMAERKKITLTSVLPDVPAESLVVAGEGSQLERVIGNLVANAIKFTPHDGKVTMALENFPDHLTVSVADNGPGIPAEFLERVFDKFQQVKGGVKATGTGLGLTICKYFIELHKGKIWVESEVGKGAKFIFWVPKDLVKNAAGEVLRRLA